MGKRRFCVRSSGIHGKGVFCLMQIKTEDVIAIYTGEKLTDLFEVTRRTKQRPAGHTMFACYKSNSGELVVVDGAIGGNSTRFINHGCDPNCQFQTDGKNVIVCAIKDIFPGEELLLDYALESIAESVSEEEALAYACKCGSPKCRGTMLNTG